MKIFRGGYLWRPPLKISVRQQPRRPHMDSLNNVPEEGAGRNCHEFHESLESGEVLGGHNQN